MKRMKRILKSAGIALIAFMLTFTAVWAIANPDNISFGTGTTALYRVFENVLEDGDMMFVAEGFVDYAAEPDESASEAFIFEVLNTAGNVTLAATTVNAYGDRPLSIYKTATQVAGNFTSGTAYILRIMGNPILFPTPVDNSVNATLAPSDYIDQLLGVDDGVATANPLRNFLISMADNIEDEDTPVDPYIVYVSGIRYLTADGGTIFIEGIPNLQNICPILFQNSLSIMEGDAPEVTGAYANTLTPIITWGSTVANGLTNLGLYVGLNQALAGSVILFFLVAALAIWIYKETESGLITLLLLATTPFLGAWLGLMPIALAFIMVIALVILGGYFFFSRGAL